MSLKSWKEKHYPITARESVKRANGDPLVLIDHAICKWEGAVLSASAAHKLEYEDHALWGKGTITPFHFQDDTCALCVSTWNEYHEVTCGKCPIYVVTDDTCEHVYRQSEDDPSLMIALLKKVREKLESKGKSK